MSKAGKKTTKLQAEKPVADDATQAAAVDPDETRESAPAAEGESAPAAETATEPDPLEVMAAERDQFQEKWLRVVAELDNVRKRSSRELVQTRKFAEADVLRAFLEILDNMERALQAAPDQGDTEAAAGFRAGVELIHQRLQGVFKERDVKAMEVLNQEFDPNYHEAVGQLPREGVESGLVIEVVQTGYHFGDMVLRPARVIISA